MSSAFMNVRRDISGSEDELFERELETHDSVDKLEILNNSSKKFACALIYSSNGRYYISLSP